MVSITLSIPEKTRETMKRFPEMNWSGFVRKSIEEKTKHLATLKELEKELDKDQEITSWAVKLQRAGRSGRLEQLKKKGLI